MRLGLLPAVGAGLTSLEKTGQLGRLHAQAAWYRREFECVDFLSYQDDRQAWPHGELVILDDWYRRPRTAWLWPLRYYNPDISVYRALNLLGAIPAITMKRRWGIPFVVSHGADYEAIARVHGRSGLHLKKWGWLRRLVFSQAAAVLVSNPVLAAKFRLKFPRANIVDHPNWVDTDHFCKNQPAGQISSPKVYYVGRLVPEKNLLVAARACKLVDVDFVCVGEGPLEGELRHLGALCLGPKPWTDLPAILANASVFLMPSLTEGHCKALIEAMACEIPCVVSDRIDGIKPGTAAAVPPTVLSLADAIYGVLDPGFNRADMARRARAWVVKEFSAATLMLRENAMLSEVAYGGR